MKAEEAIKVGVGKHAKSQEKKSLKRIFRPLTAIGIYRVFMERFRSSYGIPPMLTVRDQKMLKGFIKVWQGNNKEDGEAYQLILDLVDNWDSLRRLETYTLKGKRCSLPNRPSLSHILTCRDSLMGNLGEILSSDEGAGSSGKPLEAPPRHPSLHKRAPTHAEIDKEYETEY